MRSTVTVRRKIRLRVPVGQQCRQGIAAKERVLEDLKKKLLSQGICDFPCQIHNVGLKCRLKRNPQYLQAIFEIELDKNVVFTSQHCNTSCLQCQMENRLQRFVSDLRNLANNDKLNVSVNGKEFRVGRRSVKASRLTHACDQRSRNRRKSKRGGGLRYRVMFLSEKELIRSRYTLICWCDNGVDRSRYRIVHWSHNGFGMWRCKMIYKCDKQVSKSRNRIIYWRDKEVGRS